MKRPIASLVWAFSLAATTSAQPPSSPVPPDPAIRKILVDHIDKYKQSVGMVVGIVEPQGRRVVAYGSLNQGDPRPLNGDTIFEIGSVTNVFTSLLLADMAQRGEVSLNDPIAKYLPSNVVPPVRNGRAITLVDLSTHTSGLPPDADNFKPKSSDSREADYSYDMLYEFLSGYRLPRDPGSRFDYSNIGPSLLAIAVSRQTGRDYEVIVKERITAPLGLTSTGITLTPEMRQRFATGHNESLEPAPETYLKVFAGAGALRSSTNDMLTFLAAELGYTQTLLYYAMASMLEVSRPMTQSSFTRFLNRGEWEAHLAWFSTTAKGSTLYYHGGATLGFRSFIGFDPKSRVGVVVLSNGLGTIDEIGMHLLNPKIELPKPSR